MKTIVGAALAFLFGTMLLSSDAEARCWWNATIIAAYYDHGWWYHGY